MSAETLLGLAVRVEAYDPKLSSDNRADERALDLEIGKALGMVPANAAFTLAGLYSWDETGNSVHHLPAFTYSVDAAMTLVPEGWSALVRIGKRNMAWVEGEYGSPEDGTDTSHEIKAVCATPALALTAAALRARAASCDTHPKDGDGEATAPLVSGAVGAEGDETPETPTPSTHNHKENEGG